MKKLSSALPLLALCLPALAQESDLPRHLTPAEAAHIARHPITTPKVVTPPPTGPVVCVAEYEPMQAIVMSYEGGTSWLNILAEMAASITTTGNADVWMVCDNAGETTTALNKLQAYGTDMSRVKTLVVPTDSIWIRDYGPRYIYQGGVRAVVDHTYNRPRPLDDALNGKLGPLVGHRVFELDLIHGGGNYHLSALGDSYASELIVNENPGKTAQEIIDIWMAYQNVQTTIATPFPTSIDSTQHIDMWMQVIDDRAVLISDWPADVGSFQDKICDGATAELISRGYTVTRVPARKISGTHYTYTNLVMCNGLVLLPSYTNPSMLAHNVEALTAVQTALPGKTVVQVPCQNIVTASGVMHCIVQHVPVPTGGVVPTAYMISLNGAEVLTPGSNETIEWGTDDDVAVTSVDVEYSPDNGASWSLLGTGLAPYGSLAWTVPGAPTSTGLLRVTAYDGLGNFGADLTDSPFVISGGTGGLNIPYGTGKPGLNGMPVLSSVTPPNIGQVWTADLTNALANAPAFLAFGYAKATTPFDGGTLLVNYSTLYNLATNGAGTAFYTTTVPAMPALIGLSVYWQVGIPNDPGASGAGWAMTGGLEAKVGQ